MFSLRRLFIHHWWIDTALTLLEIMKLAFLILLFILLGCTSKKKSKEIPSLDYKGDCLDERCAHSAGEFALFSGGPSRKPIYLSGHCMFMKPGDDYKYPIRHTRVKIQQEGKTLAEAGTDINGFFEISAHLDAGYYELVLDSQRYSARLNLEVYKPRITEILLLAK